MQQTVCRARCRRSAFTLLELLVVIGIILVLISILLPVVNKVRRSVYDVSTRQVIGRLEAGIQTYLLEHGSYPGPFANVQLNTRPALAPPNVSPLVYEYSSNGTSFSTDSARTNITGTENLYLAMVGGLVPPNATNTNFRVVSNYAQIPYGPMSLNPAAIKRHNSYLSLEPRETTAVTDARFYSNSGTGARYANANDTSVPEVLDAYPEALPILYMRANKNQQNIIGLTTDSPLRQYTREQLVVYGFPATNDATYLSEFPSQGDLAAGDQAYFGSPGLSRAGALVPYQKDGCILISAGYDGKYGTQDDITNFRNN